MAFPMRDHTIPPMSSRCFQSPSVIPDVFNRESMAFPMWGHTIPPMSFPTSLIGNPWLFPMQDHTNEGTEEKDTGFPLTTGGNDKGDR